MIQAKLVAALLAGGSKEVLPSPTSKARCFTRGADDYWYVGKAGSLRFGKNYSSSLAAARSRAVFLGEKLSPRAQAQATAKPKSVRSVAAANRKMAFNKPTTEDLNVITAANELARLKATHLDGQGRNLVTALQLIVDGGKQNGFQTTMELTQRYLANAQVKPAPHWSSSQLIRMQAEKVPGGKAYNTLVTKLKACGDGDADQRKALTAEVGHLITATKPSDKSKVLPGHLARGLSSHDAPNCSASIRANRAQAKPVKAASAPTAPKAAKLKTVPTGQPKRTSAAAFRELIMAGKLTDDKIFASVQAEFGLSDDKKSYVKWYRNELTKKGLSPPPPVEA